MSLTVSRHIRLDKSREKSLGLHVIGVKGECIGVLVETLRSTGSGRTEGWNNRCLGDGSLLREAEAQERLLRTSYLFEYRLVRRTLGDAGDVGEAIPGGGRFS